MEGTSVSYRFYRLLLWMWDLATLNVVLLLLISVADRVDVASAADYKVLFFFFNFAWVASVSLTTLYLSKQWLSFEIFLKKTAQCFLLASLAILGFIFAFKYDFSRLFVASYLVLFGLMLFVNRIVFQFLVRRAKRKFNRRVIVLGNNEVSRKLVSYFKAQSQFVTVVGCFFDTDESQVSGDKPILQIIQREDGLKKRSIFLRTGSFVSIAKNTDYDEDSLVTLGNEVHNVRKGGFKDRKSKRNSEIPLLGSVSDWMDFARQNDVTEVYSTISPEQNPAMLDYALMAEESFIHFKFVLDINLFMKRKFHVDFIDNLPVLSLRSEPLEEIGNRIRKRLLDIGVSVFVILFLLSWLTPLLAILIKLESKGPVFFLQQRSGRRNKPFWCIKFRSLKVNDESDIKQVTKTDDRITKVGRFIRKTNIDELPQFFNVLSGHMSVVGPRPHMLKHTLEFQSMYKEYMIRHFVKPGITGLAQVRGFRGEIKSREFLKRRIEHDVHYMENWSLWLDIKLILATVMVTIEGDKNAY